MYLATETLILWVPLLLLGRRLSWEWETGTGHRLGRQETKQSHFQESSGCVLTREQMHYWQEFRKLTLEGGLWRQASRQLPAENLAARWHQIKIFQFQVVMQEMKQDHRASVKIRLASLKQWKVRKRQVYILFWTCRDHTWKRFCFDYSLELCFIQRNL